MGLHSVVGSDGDKLENRESHEKDARVLKGVGPIKVVVPPQDSVEDVGKQTGVDWQGYDVGQGFD